MGDFLNRVDRLRVAPVSVAHRVALFLSSSERRAVISEGGDDTMFYSVLMKKNYPEKIQPVVEFFAAQGRKRVLDAMDVLQNMGKLDRSFAIVDRDFHFNDPSTLSDGHCLVLDVYSFENLFGDSKILINMGKLFFGLEPGSPHLADWTLSVDMFLGSLQETLIGEHAIGLWCKINSKNCALSDFKVARHLKCCANGAVTSVADIKQKFIDETSSDLIEASEEDISNFEIQLAGMPWQLWFRGHYFWILYVNMLNAFRESIDSDRKTLKQSRSRTRQELSARHVIEAATSFVPCPMQLIRFFELVNS